MIKKQLATILASSVILLACADNTVGDTFGSGENAFEIDFVTIGNPGNADDTINVPKGHSQGGVDYTYRIGKYEVSTGMINKVNAEASLGISHKGDDSTHPVWRYEPNRPAFYLSWYGAATFVNWLNESTGNAPAYKFDNEGNFQLWEPNDPGYDSENLFRNSLTNYILPDVDEWYKAAFYDGGNDVYYDYPTGSNDVPDGIDFAGDTTFDAVFNDGHEDLRANDYMDVGISSPYGTFGQGGNVWEWGETAFDYVNSSPTEGRAVRGGDWDVSSSTGSPNSAWFTGKWSRNGAANPLTRPGIGMRVASLALTPGNFASALGNFDGDGDIDGADFLKFQRGFGVDYSTADLTDWINGYGTTDGLEAVVGAVPEPSSMALLLTAGVGLLLRKRSQS